MVKIEVWSKRKDGKDIYRVFVITLWKRLFIGTTFSRCYVFELFLSGVITLIPKGFSSISLPPRVSTALHVSVIFPGPSVLRGHTQLSSLC